MPRMKRVPEPFWRSERNCWFVQIGKKQHRLDPDEETAKKLYHELMAKPPEERVAPLPSTSGLLIPIMDAFLDWTKTHQSGSRLNCTRTSLPEPAQDVLDGDFSQGLSDRVVEMVLGPSPKSP